MFESGTLEYDLSFILIGMGIATVIYAATYSPQAPCDCNTIKSIETGNEMVTLIGNGWTDCALSFDSHNRMGWKCDRFWAEMPYYIYKEPQQPEPTPSGATQ